MTKTNSHKPKTSTQNKKVKDSGARLIFGDPILCARFLRGYTDIELLKDVRPEDIEDVTDRFISVWQEERDSDTVKKIRLKNQEDIDTLYLITLIEHQTKVDYDISFRILRYIVLILTDYAAEAEKKQAGCTALKGSGILLFFQLSSMMETGTGQLQKTFRNAPHFPIFWESIFQTFSIWSCRSPAIPIRS